MTRTYPIAGAEHRPSRPRIRQLARALLTPPVLLTAGRHHPGPRAAGRELILQEPVRLTVGAIGLISVVPITTPQAALIAARPGGRTGHIRADQGPGRDVSRSQRFGLAGRLLNRVGATRATAGIGASPHTGGHPAWRKSLANHKPGRRIGRRFSRAATVSGVMSADTLRARLGRLLLLACTVLGVVVLHTIGHALADGDEPGPVRVALVSAAPMFTASVPRDHGGCDGDGCGHHALMPTESSDTSRWWQACLALIILVFGAFSARARRPVRAVAAGGVRAGRRRPPWTVRPLVGLTVATVAVLRT